MTPSCTLGTFCGFFLAALGVAMGWGTGLFLIAQIAHALVRLFNLS